MRGEARIGQAYWAALASCRNPKNPVEAKVSLASFKKQVRAWDSLKLVDAPAGHRSLGTIRAITQVRSGDLILEGRSYLSFPRASAFACDGRLVRISNGSEYDPDSHLLYEWQLCRSEEHTSELQSLMRISYAVFCLKKKITY